MYAESALRSGGADGERRHGRSFSTTRLRRHGRTSVIQATPRADGGTGVRLDVHRAAVDLEVDRGRTIRALSAGTCPPCALAGRRAGAAGAAGGGGGRQGRCARWRAGPRSTSQVYAGKRAVIHRAVRPDVAVAVHGAKTPICAQRVAEWSPVALSRGTP